MPRRARETADRSRTSPTISSTSAGSQDGRVVASWTGPRSASRTRTVSPRSRRSRAVWLPMNPAPPVIRTRSAMLGRTPPRDHHGDRAQHDRDVQPDRPSLDVVEIDRQHLREGNPAARRDLVETADPRLHRQPQAAAVVVERVLLGDRWARADDAHVALSTLSSWGTSSRLSRRRTRPTGVTLGSPTTLNRPSRYAASRVTNSRSHSRWWLSSATTMLRNL